MVFTQRPGSPENNKTANYQQHPHSQSRAVTGPIPQVRNPYCPQSPYDHTYQQQPFFHNQQNPQTQRQAFYQQQSAKEQTKPENLKGLGFWQENDNSYQDSSEEDISQTSPLKFVVIIVGLIITSTVLWLGYRWATQSHVDNPPLIMAETGPYKIQPENPGGMNFPHQEMLVYGQLSPQQNQNHYQQNPERLMPEQEHYYQNTQEQQDYYQNPGYTYQEPQNQQAYTEQQYAYQYQNTQQLPAHNQQQYMQQQNQQPNNMQQPYPQQPIQQNTPALNDSVAEQMPMLPAQSTTPNTADVQKDFVENKITPPPASTIVETNNQTSQNTIKTTEDNIATEKKENTNLTEEKKPETNTDAVKDILSEKKQIPTNVKVKENYFIFFGNLPSTASAKNEWARLKKKFPADFKDANMSIKQNEMGVKKVYRIIIGPFDNRNTAFKKCLKIGQSCKVMQIKPKS